MANKRDAFSHTKWLCKYHIVFMPEYRRKAIYGELRKDIGHDKMTGERRDPFEGLQVEDAGLERSESEVP